MNTNAASAGLQLRRYQNTSGRSGVSAYADFPDTLVVEFGDGQVYLYNYDCPGRLHVEHMKTLAHQGQRLSTYISRHVGKRYAARLR